MQFRSLFKRKFVLVYSALTDEECIRVKGKLLDAGIFHKTKVGGIYFADVHKDVWGKQMSQYNFYVRVEDEHKANEVIHSS
jgi:hypothetical protein